MSILVIKPSTNITNAPQINDILKLGIAKGFKASKKSADKCDILIITDGITTQAADIKLVTEKLVPPRSKGATRWVKRIDISFHNIRNLTSSEQAIVNNINWSSSNVRFK